MRTDLLGVTVQASRIHGALAITNTLFDPRSLQLKKILRWVNSSVGPSFVDHAHLAITSLAASNNSELGETVSEILEEPTRFTAHPLAVRLVDVAVAPRSVVLLAWLQHITTGDIQEPLPVLWSARNIKPVLRTVAANKTRRLGIGV